MKRHSTRKSKTREISSKKEKEQEACKGCSRDLSKNQRALFVEEEVGRVFCSEECISTYFSPEIERLEKEYFRHLSPGDLSNEERDHLSHLRWLTLQEPDEIWREKTISGDHRFTLISEFHPENRRVWCVCICLFLRGEPSFLYLAFPTKNSAMVSHYRKGERIELGKMKDHPSSKNLSHEETSEPNIGLVDGLADSWTEDETIRAQLTRNRRSDDIPAAEFSLYHSCLEETLQEPDEVWSMEFNESTPHRLYHFLRHYPDERPGIWYIVVARETENAEEIEILDAFPTQDPEWVDQFRR